MVSRVSRHERLPLAGSVKLCQSPLFDGDVFLESVNINLPRETPERVVTVGPIKRTIDGERNVFVTIYTVLCNIRLLKSV